MNIIVLYICTKCPRSKAQNGHFEDKNDDECYVISWIMLV